VWKFKTYNLPTLDNNIVEVVIMWTKIQGLAYELSALIEWEQLNQETKRIWTKT
jgi:hypothetical protein